MNFIRFRLSLTLTNETLYIQLGEVNAVSSSVLVQAQKVNKECFVRDVACFVGLAREARVGDVVG